MAGFAKYISLVPGCRYDNHMAYGALGAQSLAISRCLLGIKSPAIRGPVLSSAYHFVSVPSIIYSMYLCLIYIDEGCYSVIAETKCKSICLVFFLFYSLLCALILIFRYIFLWFLFFQNSK